MSAALYSFSIEAGATFDPLVFQYTRAGTDFSGWTAQLQARRMYSSSVALLDIAPTLVSSTDTATVTVEMTAEVTKALPPGVFPYALEISHPDGEPVIRLVEGVVTVDREVVR